MDFSHDFAFLLQDFPKKTAPRLSPRASAAARGDRGLGAAPRDQPQPDARGAAAAAGGLAFFWAILGFLMWVFCCFSLV